jgi:Transglutaminase-like superfamily
MTQPGRYAALVDDLPADVAELVGIVQGLLVYEDVASDFYGFELPAERGVEKHLRTEEAMLERLLALEDRPLAQPRPVERRLAGRCHHFTVMLLSMMRAKDIPARARCGFGAYFNPGYYEDHWVAEYWNSVVQRWVLVDPQFDDVWRERLQIQHNILDVPRDSGRRCKPSRSNRTMRLRPGRSGSFRRSINQSSLEPEPCTSMARTKSAGTTSPRYVPTPTRSSPPSAVPRRRSVSTLVMEDVRVLRPGWAVSILVMEDVRVLRPGCAVSTLVMEDVHVLRRGCAVSTLVMEHVRVLRPG